MSSTALATVLIDELARCGLQHLCLAPGSRSAPLAMAAAVHPGVDVHVDIDERSVAFLALGIARTAGRPAAVVSTSGTAAVNFHPAVVEAHESRIPLLVLTADRPPELRDTAANQTIDQTKLYGNAVRWFTDVGADVHPGAVAYWRSLVCRAWAEATGGPAGPVHVNVPLREPLVPSSGDTAAVGGFPHPLDGRPDGRPWTATHRPAARLDGGGVAAIAEQLSRAERGVVVAGDSAGDPAAVTALAEHLGWPLLADPLSSARSGANAVGAYHHLLTHPGFAATHRPDIVLRVGKTGLSRALLGFLDAATPQVLVDADVAWLDPTRTVGDVIQAHPGAFSQAVREAAPLRGDGGWLAGWRRADAAVRSAIDAVLDDEDLPTEPRIARDVAAAAPAGTLLVAASSMPVRDLDMFMSPRPELRVIGNRGASGIDGFVSTALGAALASPGPVWALSGDLSLLHDQSGFLLLGERPDLVIVVVNNDGGGIFSFLPQAGFPDVFERLFGTPHGLDLARLAALHDLGYTRLEKAADLSGVLTAAGGAGGVQLIEARTDRAANLALHRRLAATAAAALDQLEASPPRHPPSEQG